VCVKAHPPLLNYIKMRTQAKQIIKIINETSNDYDAVDEVVEFLNKEKTEKRSEIESIKQVILMLNQEIKTLRFLCYLACSIVALIIVYKIY
jgi:c-di-GMP-related signal transduction protein